MLQSERSIYREKADADGKSSLMISICTLIFEQKWERGMSQGYEIRSHEQMGTTILVLAKTGSQDFLEKMKRDKRKKQTLRLIIETMEGIKRRGINKCIGRSNFIRSIAPDVGLMEVRVPGKVIRVMTYVGEVEGKTDAVLLFDFTAHGGKTGKISPRHIDKGKRLAKIAKECIEEDE
jgi:hypothetical protein